MYLAIGAGSIPVLFLINDESALARAVYMHGVHKCVHGLRDVHVELDRPLVSCLIVFLVIVRYYGI